MNEEVVLTERFRGTSALVSAYDWIDRMADRGWRLSDPLWNMEPHGFTPADGYTVEMTKDLPPLSESPKEGDLGAFLSWMVGEIRRLHNAAETDRMTADAKALASKVRADGERAQDLNNLRTERQRRLGEAMR